MARKPGVKYYASRSAYYTTIAGQQHKLASGPEDSPLGPTFTAALTAFRALNDLAQAGTVGDCNTVRAIFKLYTEHQTKNRSAATSKGWKNVSRWFVEMFGDLRIDQLRRHHCEEFLTFLRTPRTTERKRVVVWKNTRLPLVYIKACFNWAVSMEYIRTNPFATVKNVKATARGEETVIRVADLETLMSYFRAGVKEILQFLAATGCRPDEAYNLKASDYDRREKCVIYRWNAEAPDYIWKNAAKTQKDRVILLDDEMVELVERKIKEVGSGYLFRTTQGSKFSNDSLCLNLRRMKKKFGIDVKPYSLRHTYATQWLQANGSVKVLADLMGTSVAMIEKHYGHTMTDKAKMRELMIATMKAK